MSFSLLKVAALCIQAALLQTPESLDIDLDSVAWESNVVVDETKPSSSELPSVLETATAVQPPKRVAGVRWETPAWRQSAVENAGEEVPTVLIAGRAHEPWGYETKEAATQKAIEAGDVKTVPWAATRNAQPDPENGSVPKRGLNEVPAWDSGATIDFANADKSGIEVVNRDADLVVLGPKSPPWRSVTRKASFQGVDPGEISNDELEDLYSKELDSIEPADINDPELQGGDLKDLDGNAISVTEKLNRSPATRENPGWWIQALQQPLLSGRQLLPTNLDEVMFVALRNSPQVQIFNSRPIIQETIVGEANAQFDWTQFVETTWNETDEPVGSQLTTGNGGRFVQREWTLDAGLRRQLRNGASLSFTQRYGTIANNSTFLDPPNQGNAQLFLDYRQPLLRNRGRFVNMSQVALASLDFDAVSGESRTALQEYLVSVVQSYWNVYFRRAALAINRRGLERGKELLRQLRLRDGIDVRNDQLLRAEAAVASRRSDVIRAEYELINAQDQLINASVGPKYLAGTPEQVEFMPVAFDLPLGIQFDPTTIAQSAVYNRPEVQQSIAELRAAAVRNQVSQNQILPRLDAVLTATANGLRGNKNVGGAFTDQFTQGNPSYSAGFEFEIPVGNRAARYRAERARVEMTLAHREFESQVGDVLVDARIASREVSRLNSENQNNWAALMKANEELFLIQERQRLQLDDGKVGSLYIEDLLASQARLTAAEIRLAQSQTQQAVALVDLKRAVGVLVSGNDQTTRPVTFSPSFMPGAQIEQVQIADVEGWQQPTQFDALVSPAVGTQPVSNYPQPVEVQPVSGIDVPMPVQPQQAVQQPAAVWNSQGGVGVIDRQPAGELQTREQFQVVASPPVPQTVSNVVQQTEQSNAESLWRTQEVNPIQVKERAGGFGFPGGQRRVQPVAPAVARPLPAAPASNPNADNPVQGFFGFPN